ncbi:uncharacterized protein [Trachinotus anak]|uniref:uncharacterized protein n=1 Tax=Trachinotus anak TaxID=443729 RepID=UPI0039F1E33D
MESSVDEELQLSNTEVTQEERDEDPPQNRDLDQVFQDTESFKQEQLSLHSDQDQVVVQDKDGAQEDVDVGDQTCLPDPPENQIQVQEVNQNPLEVHDGRQRAEEETQESDLSLVNQDLFGAEQIQDQDQTADLDRASLQDQNQAEHHLVHHDDSDLDQVLMGAAANQDEAGEPGGSVPALVVTQAEESLSASAGPPVSPVEPPERPADLVTPAAVNLFTEPSLSSSSDGGDMTCSDLLSLRSDSLSLASEPTISRRSEEDDTRSVTASSVMSLFHRVQLDPLEKDWWRSSALGNMAAQRQLLAQDPGLVLKKVQFWSLRGNRIQCHCVTGRSESESESELQVREETVILQPNFIS